MEWLKHLGQGLLDYTLGAIGVSLLLILRWGTSKLLGKTLVNMEATMLEGTELEGKIGTIGTYKVDVTPNLELDLSVGVKLPLIKYLKDLAAKTATPIDDKAIEWIESLFPKAP